jgi:hypothetical protein
MVQLEPTAIEWVNMLAATDIDFQTDWRKLISNIGSHVLLKSFAGFGARKQCYAATTLGPLPHTCLHALRMACSVQRSCWAHFGNKLNGEML